MRSLIIIEVEHGEGTDALQDFVDFLSLPVNADVFSDGSLLIKDYTVKVDIPGCFVLDS